MILNPAQISPLPIFIGLTNYELSSIVQQAHFDVRHYKKGSVIINEYENCDSLLFITEGWTESDTYADSRAYHIKELAQGPLVIEPEKLFGMTQHYSTAYTAYTPCTVLRIPKSQLLNLLERHVIVRMNYLNILCRKTQKLESMPWQRNSTEPIERIKKFIHQHCIFPTGKKTLYIKMRQLADEINFSRMEVSQALNAMEKEEKIILKRGIIEVPALQLL